MVNKMVYQTIEKKKLENLIEVKLRDLLLKDKKFLEDIISEGFTGLNNMFLKDVVEHFSDYLGLPSDIIIDDIDYSTVSSLTLMNAKHSDELLYSKERGLSLLFKYKDKEIKYTHGLKYRKPTTLDVPISFDEAVDIIKKNSLVDMRVNNDVVYINTYSANDMW